MQDVVLESTRSLTQAEFAAWVARRAGEPDRYELLNGRIVTTPPAGYPRGLIEGTLVHRIRELVDARKLGKALDRARASIYRRATPSRRTSRSSPRRGGERHPLQRQESTSASFPIW